MRFETPNAVMERIDGSTEVAMWRTEMAAGASGPTHVVDVEQVVLVLDGVLHAAVDGDEHVLTPGRSIVVPAGAERVLRNGADATLVTVTSSRPGATARVGDAAPVPVPWTA